MPASAIVTSSTTCGQSAWFSAKYVAAIAPTQICPSAPMFQKRILNASVTPSDVISSGIASFAVSSRLIFEPSEPVIAVA
ncbi:MAG: hypothetical protein BWY81_01497 [Firmicutes bacterium ADurb.Bin467]|nr:MAG: hypothetical protein BWY81_01497 [Firmicutes bacterium ADurb.Bin467]